MKTDIISKLMPTTKSIINPLLTSTNYTKEHSQKCFQLSTWMTAFLYHLDNLHICHITSNKHPEQRKITQCATVHTSSCSDTCCIAHQNILRMHQVKMLTLMLQNILIALFMNDITNRGIIIPQQGP